MTGDYPPEVQEILDAIGRAISWDCEPADMAALARIIEARLPRRQVTGLTAAFLSACDNEDALELAEITQDRLSAGEPIPDFLDCLKDEAKNWAALACDAEKRTYITAIWSSLERPARIEFINVARKHERI